MKSLPRHINWLVNTNQQLRTADGKEIEVWEFQHQDDDNVLSAWARHFREQYCSDSQIDVLRSGTGLSRSEYLKTIKFPDKTQPPGSSIRAGDFAEILVADFLEFLNCYWVPRTRDNKTIRNESTKGCDVIGFKLVNCNDFSPQDELAIFESKTGLTNGKKNRERLQDAVDDSGKDVTRKAESLNAIKQRFLNRNRIRAKQIIERLQNEVDNPYQEFFGAVALIDNCNYDEYIISQTSTVAHPKNNCIRLIVIRGEQLMSLVHSLYERAANEA
ncbi:MAG: DUF1837 domain-containing protein [Bacteroidales bacterium]|nr:DUF1837 domain-containing protein [Bacteroidales bacterium]